MHRPFLTTVSFKNEDGGEVRLEYAVSATSTLEAKAELERRFFDLEVFGYTIEHIVSAPRLQALLLKLPPRCIMLLA